MTAPTFPEPPPRHHALHDDPATPTTEADGGTLYDPSLHETGHSQAAESVHLSIDKPQQGLKDALLFPVRGEGPRAMIMIYLLPVVVIFFGIFAEPLLWAGLLLALMATPMLTATTIQQTAAGATELHWLPEFSDLAERGKELGAVLLLVWLPEVLLAGLMGVLGSWFDDPGGFATLVSFGFFLAAQCVILTVGYIGFGAFAVHRDWSRVWRLDLHLEVLRQHHRTLFVAALHGVVILLVAFVGIFIPLLGFLAPAYGTIGMAHCIGRIFLQHELSLSMLYGTERSGAP